MTQTKTPKETKVLTETIGYSYPKYSTADPIPVLVRISGQGPYGKLKGRAYVYPKGTQIGWRDPKINVELTGDGQYSFMHGNRSLNPWTDDTVIAKQIRHDANFAATQYIEANPNALHEFRVKQAEIALSKAQSEVKYAEASLHTAKQHLLNAEEVLQRLTG